jgi:pimeloyl-ACP methyl ester carboxylesterase
MLGRTGARSPRGTGADMVQEVSAAMARRRPFALGAAAAAALVLIVAALVQLRAAGEGVRETETVLADGTPVTLFLPENGPPGPAVVVAHGFSGSRPLMRSFALALARNGSVAATFDFSGHGRNPRPLTGSITETAGATRRLVEDVAEVAAFVRPLGDGRLAVLGHSMASDIVVRFAEAHPEVGATIAVSMFSPAVTAVSPRNLLVIVGDWEGPLKREALRVLGLASAPAEPQAERTLGDPGGGGGRRVTFSPHVEHVGVLYSEHSLREAVDWLDQSFSVRRPQPPVIPVLGPWVLALLAGAVLLAWPLSRLLPEVSPRPAGASLAWRHAWVLVLPLVVTPLVLRVVPTDVLPVLVGDYLAAHFFVYGVVSLLALLAVRRSADPFRFAPVSVPALLAATLAVLAYVAVALFWPLDSYVTSFVPGRHRLFLLAAMLVGTLPHFLADEWLTRGEHAARGLAIASKAAFLVSLGVAVALDPGRLFFLVLIVPVMVPFFLAFGLIGRWTYQRTQSPLVGGLANAVVFAWAIAVTFPLLSR